MKKYIEDLTVKTVKKAEKIYGKSFPMIPIDFDLKGKTAGMYCWGFKRSYLRFNLEIAKINKEGFDTTVIHEVAHFIARALNMGKYIKPHGIEWKNVMRSLGISNPKRCHSYSVASSSRMTYYKYKCECQEHELSAIIHNRIQRNPDYYRACKRCKAKLVKV